MPANLAASFLSPEGGGPMLLLALAIFASLVGAAKTLPKITRGIARVDTAAREIVGDEKTPSLSMRLSDHSQRISAVEKELRPNGGGSMRDAITRVERLAEDAKVAAATVADRLEASTAQASGDRAALAAEVRAAHVKVDTLMNALDQYAQERWAKDEYAAIRERAYIRALKSFGLDLTSVAEALVPEDHDADT